MSDLDQRIYELKHEIKDNTQIKKELFSKIPYNVGKDTDLEKFFDKLSEDNFITFYYDSIYTLGEEYTIRCIENLNDDRLPERVLRTIYIQKKLKTNVIKRPAITLQPTSSTKSMVPYIFCISGKRVTSYELNERINELGIKKYKWSFNKLKRILESENVLEKTEDILISLGF